MNLYLSVVIDENNKHKVATASYHKSHLKMKEDLYRKQNNPLFMFHHTLSHGQSIKNFLKDLDDNYMVEKDTKK